MGDAAYLRVALVGTHPSMKPNPLHRLPAPLEAAVQRLKLTAREAAERSIESLGLAALAATNAYQRDGLLGAQFELNRKSAVFALTFNDALDERVLRELGPRAAANNPDSAFAASRPTSTLTDWATLSLVEDKEVEAQISADRFGLEIAHACEWELRELDGYVGSLLTEAAGPASGLGDRNPLRPDLVGHAMLKGIEAISDRADVRKVLSGELSRSLGGLLRTAYGDIVAELRNAGVQPQGLTVRNRPQRPVGGWGPGGPDEHSNSSFNNLGRAGDDRTTRSGYASIHGGPGGYAGPGGPSGYAGPGGPVGYGGPGGPGGPGGRSGPGSFGPSTRTGAGMGRSFGHVDPALMTLIRRLNVSGAPENSSYGTVYADDGGEPMGMPAPPNLIRVHREELRQASTGALDHMVIDVIGFMFDQILADPKVPPQMARQIARLQLPVLRAALGDGTFFSSRRHPVRRFINRIASLGSAFEDFGEEGAKAFLAKVKALIHEVVDGDFEHIDVYEQKLAALEAFTAELAARDTSEIGGAADLLSEKEDQARLRQLYAMRLSGELKDLSAPPFLRDFISRVWSQVLLRAAEQNGPDGPLTQRLRTVARDLFMSVQAKATPAHRKSFLAELPKLMQDLTEGMNLINWPEAQRRAFFGQLMPAHAEALKSPLGRQLDINLMARQVDGALQRPLPVRADLKTAPNLPVLTEELSAPQFTPEEVQRVGLVQESQVDWDGKVDIDLSAEPDLPPDTGPELPGLPAAAEPAEPVEGRSLADSVQIGFAYRMHLNEEWQKVRLTHISPGRGFFIFKHGGKGRKTVSLTQRMLVRLCETGRFKAYESAYLVERATARARRQLAGLASPATTTSQPAGI
jgi:Protein of unknown function (DUF1631)